MSGHVEGFFECNVTLTVGSTKGPFAYDGHRIAEFMAALEEALGRVSFSDPITKETHTINDALVWHVGPTLSSLQHHILEASRGRAGDVVPPSGGEYVSLRRTWQRGGKGR